MMEVTLICQEKEEREKKKSGKWRPLPHRSVRVYEELLVASSTLVKCDQFGFGFGNCASLIWLFIVGYWSSLATVIVTGIFASV